MADIDDPDHPGWALWHQIREEERTSWELFRDMRAETGRPHPPFEPLPKIPPAGRLDALVMSAVEEYRRAQTFTYWVTKWDGMYPGVVAERNAQPPHQGAVLYDGFRGGGWIFDPKQLSEIRHQAFQEPHWTLTRVSREEAERVESEQGRTLPSTERLLEICEKRIGVLYGSSATPEDRAAQG